MGMYVLGAPDGLMYVKSIKSAYVLVCPTITATCRSRTGTYYFF